MLALSLFAVLYYPTNLTWWAFLMAVAIAFTFSLPIGIVEAVTGRQIGLNVLTEFVYGYIQPGRPLALMLYVQLQISTYMLSTLTQSPQQVQNIRLHHHVSHQLPFPTLTCS